MGVYAGHLDYRLIIKRANGDAWSLNTLVSGAAGRW